MSDLLIRRVPAGAAAALKKRGVDERRSASAEAARTLTDFATGTARDAPLRRYTLEETIAAAARWRARLAGRAFDDSTAITRHDRDSDHGRI